MSAKLALVTVILVISLATSYSATGFGNRTLSATPKPRNATHPPFRTSQFRFPNQRYFVFNNREVAFFEAWQLCASMGLQLASVNTAEDDGALKLALRAADPNQVGPWWIAGTDLGKQGHFVWISTVKPVGYRTGYTNFAPGEPNNVNGEEHCVEAGWPSGTLWNDKNCDVRRRYVCETYALENC